MLTIFGSCRAPAPDHFASWQESLSVPFLSGEVFDQASEIFQFLKNAPQQEINLDSQSLDFFESLGMDRQILLRPEFDAADVRYVWSRRCFYERAQSLTGNLETPSQKAQALVEWIHLNVNASSIGENREALGLMSEMVLWRGYGYCDRSALLFVEMCRQIQLPAMLYVFRNPDGSSPHTVAVFYDQKNWFFADPYNGIVYRDEKKKLLSALEALQNPQKLAHYNAFQKPNWLEGFVGGEFYWCYDPRSLMQRMHRVAKAVQEKYQAFYVQDILAERQWLEFSLPLQKKLFTWNFLVNHFRQWENPQIRMSMRIMNQATAANNLKARAAHVSGHPQEAMVLYEFEQNAPKLAVFYRAQCSFELGQFSSAEALFTKVLGYSELKRLHRVCHMYLALLAEYSQNKVRALDQWRLSGLDQERVLQAIKRLSVLP